MATIGELRNKAFGALGRELTKKMPITTFVNGYIVGAQEQDKIARAEEREKCLDVLRIIGVFDMLAAQEGMSAACMEEQLKQALEGGEEK